MTIWPRLQLLGLVVLVRSSHHHQSQTADIHQCCNGDRSGCSASQCCSSGRARGWTFEGTARGQSRRVLKRSFVLPQFSHADRRHAKKPTEFSRHMLHVKRVCTFSCFECSCINKPKHRRYTVVRFLARRAVHRQGGYQSKVGKRGSNKELVSFRACERAKLCVPARRCCLLSLGG